MKLWHWFLERFRKRNDDPEYKILTADHLRCFCIPRGARNVFVKIKRPWYETNELYWEQLDDVQPELEDNKVVLTVLGKEYRVEPDTPVKFT